MKRRISWHDCSAYFCESPGLLGDMLGIVLPVVGILARENLR